MTNLNSGGGQGFSREVLFRLGVVPDPNAPQLSRQFGDTFVREHNRIAGTAKMRAKDVAEAYRAATSSSVNSFAEFNQKGTQHLNRLADTAALRAKDFQNAWKSATDSVQARLGNVASSVSGLNGGGVSARGGSGGGAGNYGKGILDFAHGVTNLTRGAAMSGLVGEQDSQKILDVLLRMESTVSLINGSMQVGKGLGTMAGVGTGGAAGLTAFAAPVAAAIAATLSTILAGKVIHEQISGKAHSPNSVSGWIAEKEVSMEAWLERVTGYNGPVKSLNNSMQLGWDQEKTRDAMGALQKSRFQNFSGGLGQQSSNLDSLIQQNRTAGAGRTATAFQANQANQGLALEAWREAKKLADEIGSSYHTSSAEKERAAQNELQAAMRYQGLLEEQNEIRTRGFADQKKAADETLRVSERQQDVLKEQATLAKTNFDRIADKYKSDLVRFGEMNPLERRNVQIAAGRLRSGQRLSRDQEQLLEPFNEFKGDLDRTKTQRALSAGGAGLFRNELSEANAAFMAAQTSAAALQKAELDVKQNLAITVRFDAGPAVDEHLQKQLDYIGNHIRSELVKQRSEIDAMVRDAIGRQLVSRNIAAK